MIRFIDYATVAGVAFSKGMVARFDTLTELQLIAGGDAVIVKIPELIGQSFAGASRLSANAAGDASYLTLASIIVAGGLMGLNSSLIIYSDWIHPNSVSKDLGIDFGGNNVGFLTQSTGQVSCSIVTRVLASNSLAVQSTFNGINYARIASTVDTTANVNIDFKAKWRVATAAETITLVGYSVWHYPGDS